MLVALVVILTAAVGVLGVATVNLYLGSGPSSSGRQASPARAFPGEAVDPRRFEVMEERLASLRDENEGLQEQIADLNRMVVRLREGPAAGAPAPPNPAAGTEGDPPAGYPYASGRERDAAGGFVITPEDEAFIEEVQHRIRERQRFDGLTRNAMSRLDRRARTGELAEIPADRRDQVEAIVRKYVTASDAVVNRYLRSPDENDAPLAPDERRDRVQDERTQLAAQLQRDLEPLLGAEDARRAADTVIAPAGTARGLRDGERFRTQPGR
jgi:hypothetical protein